MQIYLSTILESLKAKYEGYIMNRGSGSGSLQAVLCLKKDY